MNNFLRIYGIWLVYFTALWCCGTGYKEWNGDCFFQKDIQFLQALINNSQFDKNSPPAELNPLELGWQIWENSRLVEFCSSTSTNTECRMKYQLSGIIPKEIGNLTELKKISLESNKLNGVIPQEIGELQKLIELTLSSNQLIGNIPLEIGELKSIEKLALNSNTLAGPIPPEVEQLKNLKWVYLAGNFWKYE